MGMCHLDIPFSITLGDDVVSSVKVFELIASVSRGRESSGPTGLNQSRSCRN